MRCRKLNRSVLSPDAALSYELYRMACGDHDSLLVREYADNSGGGGLTGVGGWVGGRRGGGLFLVAPGWGLQRLPPAVRVEALYGGGRVRCRCHGQPTEHGRLRQEDGRLVGGRGWRRVALPPGRHEGGGGGGSGSGGGRVGDGEGRGGGQGVVAAPATTGSGHCNNTALWAGRRRDHRAPTPASSDTNINNGHAKPKLNPYVLTRVYSFKNWFIVRVKWSDPSNHFLEITYQSCYQLNEPKTAGGHIIVPVRA